jgi:hypothetical protein
VQSGQTGASENRNSATVNVTSRDVYHESGRASIPYFIENHSSRYRSVDGRLSAFTDGEVFALPLTNSKIDDQSGLHSQRGDTSRHPHGPRRTTHCAMS